MYFYLSNDGNNPVVTAETSSGPVYWGDIYLGTCSPLYDTNCPSGDYVESELTYNGSPWESTTLEYPNQEASEYPNDSFLLQLSEGDGIPLVSIVPFSIVTTPVYGWVTTTVWHPVQITYS